MQWHFYWKCLPSFSSWHEENKSFPTPERISMKYAHQSPCERSWGYSVVLTRWGEVVSEQDGVWPTGSLVSRHPPLRGARLWSGCPWWTLALGHLCTGVSTVGGCLSAAILAAPLGPGPWLHQGLDFLWFWAFQKLVFVFIPPSVCSCACLISRSFSIAVLAMWSWGWFTRPANSWVSTQTYWVRISEDKAQKPAF